MRVIFGALCIAAALSACGRVADSRINPMNWFGGAEEQRTAPAESSPETVARDDALLQEVLTLEAAPHPGGVILTAKGLAPTQGYYDTTLVEIAREGPTLIFELRAKPPLTSQPQGTRVTREITAGRYISRQDLGDASQITVIAENNRRTVRQR